MSARGPILDRSGSITTANTSQAIAVQSYGRHYLLFQNTSAVDMNIDFGVDATTTKGVLIPAGGSIVFEQGFIPTGSVNVICATAASTFVCKEG